MGQAGAGRGVQRAGSAWEVRFGWIVRPGVGKWFEVVRNWWEQRATCGTGIYFPAPSEVTAQPEVPEEQGPPVTGQLDRGSSSATSRMAGRGWEVHSPGRTARAGPAPLSLRGWRWLASQWVCLQPALGGNKEHQGCPTASLPYS